jgi:hypothetical protein
MKRPLKRDVPAGAAIAVAALALLASVVTGREDVREERRPQATTAESVREKSIAQEDLDLERLKRQRKEGDVQDLFAGRAWNPPPAAAAPVVVEPPAPPPVPSAPPLPFKYLGRMADGDRLVVFLERNQAALSARVGDRLENDYQLESVAESAVHFVYLPLGTKQILSIPAQY